MPAVPRGVAPQTTARHSVVGEIIACAISGSPLKALVFQCDTVAVVGLAPVMPRHYRLQLLQRPAPCWHGIESVLSQNCMRGLARVHAAARCHSPGGGASSESVFS